MLTPEIQQKISTDDAFVMEEIQRLQFIFGLKEEMRYDQDRRLDDGADTVAEHVYGMHVLFDYFWPFEDADQEWDQVKMRQMINFHDLDEVITGDTIGYLKTDSHKEAERNAKIKVLESIPVSMKEMITNLLDEYEKKTSIEAKFVKAIDKIEPVVQLLSPKGKKLLGRIGTTREQHDSIKVPFFEPFPTIKRFYSVAIEKMDSEDFFAPSA